MAVTMVGQGIPWDATGLGVPVVIKDAVASENVTYTARNGTITTGDTAQNAAAANTARNGFTIQNQSTGDLYISATGTAVADRTSMKLVAGATYEFPASGVPTTAISIIGATTGQAFYAVEW